MTGAAKGDLDRFLQQEYEALVRILRARLRIDDLEAIDLAHEAVTRIYDAMAKYDPAQGNLQQWSRGFLKNLVLQHREGRMRPMTLDPWVETRPDERPRRAVGEAIADEIAQFVRASVDGLPEIYRDALRMRYLDGLELKEIARRLKVPLGTVKARLSRAPRLLREGLSIRETTARFYIEQLSRRAPPS